MSEVEAFWRTADGWSPPYADRLRQFSLLPFLSLPIVIASTPLWMPTRFAVALGLVVCGYLILSLLMFLVLRSGPRHFQSVEVDPAHFGWFADVIREAGAQLGIEHWHYSATTMDGRDRLTPGGAALALFPDRSVPSVIMLMSHHEKRSPQVDYRFVSMRHDGTVDSTGNTPPLIPMTDTHQVFDRVANAQALWDNHCERVGDSARAAELSEIVEVLAPPGDQINPIRQAGFVRFVLNWGPNVWRRRGRVAALGR